MNKTKFDKRIKQLVGELNLLNSPNAKTDKIFVDTILQPYFSKFSEERFNEICDWLFENYNSKYNKFPQMYDFRIAREATSKTFDNFDPGKNPTGEEQEEVQDIARKLAKKLKC